MRPSSVLLLASIVLILPCSAPAADSGIYTGHGIAMHGDLKYGPDFKHFEYVNPNAPKAELPKPPPPVKPVAPQRNTGGSIRRRY